ncbi:coiled-coil domain-containing protein [Streptomyces sp. 796.1]|uniref:coiled-coil domain-containing protein n=1 Tax=Streptomyces sp. 796.1 TaxID=3163029 RepID=UPI0039C9C700
MTPLRVRGACALALAASAALAQPAPTASGAPPPPAPHHGPAPAAGPQQGPRPSDAHRPPTPAGGPQRPGLLGSPGISGLLAELQTHYRAANTASARYRTIEKQLGRQRRTTHKLTARLATARTELAAARNSAGQLARQQYRGSLGFSPYVRMLLSKHPRRVLDEEHEVRRTAGRTAALTARLTQAEITTDYYASRARRALDRQQSLADRRKRERDRVRTQLDAVEALLASLTPAQLAALQQLEGYDPYAAYGTPAPPHHTLRQPRTAPTPRPRTHHPAPPHKKPQGPPPLTR